jgi:hypothetical protein
VRTTNVAAPDLTKGPPRSGLCRLGGYAILPRMIDKGRDIKSWADLLDLDDYVSFGGKA